MTESKFPQALLADALCVNAGEDIESMAAYTIVDHASAQIRCELEQLAKFCDIGTKYEGIGYTLHGMARRLRAAEGLAEHVHEDTWGGAVKALRRLQVHVQVFADDRASKEAIGKIIEELEMHREGTMPTASEAAQNKPKTATTVDPEQAWEFAHGVGCAIGDALERLGSGLDDAENLEAMHEALVRAHSLNRCTMRMLPSQATQPAVSEPSSRPETAASVIVHHGWKGTLNQAANMAQSELVAAMAKASLLEGPGEVLEYLASALNWLRAIDDGTVARALPAQKGGSDDA